MPTLNRWFTKQYARLNDEGKAALAENFETMREAFFREDVPQVQGSIPYLYQLTQHYDEPEWRLATDYYAILYEMVWRGDLARGLDLATQAALRLHRTMSADAPLGWYLQMVLFDAWLSMDGRGYAPDILRAVDAIDGHGLPDEITARLAIVRACAEVQLEPESGASSLQAILGILPMLTCWEEAYCLRVRGMGLMWAGRAEEASRDFEHATSEFERMGFPIAANDSRLSMGDALLHAGYIDQSLDVLYSALSAAERLPNRAQLGMTQGTIGKALIGHGQHEAGADWIGAALNTLDGLGWHSTEADLALARVHATYTMGLPTFVDDFADAARRAERLRSTDVRIALNALQDAHRGSA